MIHERERQKDRERERESQGGRQICRDSPDNANSLNPQAYAVQVKMMLEELQKETRLGVRGL